VSEPAVPTSIAADRTIGTTRRAKLLIVPPTCSGRNE
jgi:hypothetical protein